jgi:Peptidase M15
MKLSEYFTLEEATYSETAIRLGIDNQPSIAQLENMKHVATTHADLIRKELGHPVHINSWLRLPDVNVAVGGSKVSSHMDGWAFDMTCAEFGDTLTTAKKIAEIFKAHGVKFDQIIHEYGRWVHVSGAPEGRGQLLTIYRPENKYKPGLLSEAEYHAA